MVLLTGKRCTWCNRCIYQVGVRTPADATCTAVQDRTAPIASFAVLDLLPPTSPLLLSLSLPLLQQLFAVSGGLRPHGADEAAHPDHNHSENDDYQNSPPWGRVRQGKHRLNLPTLHGRRVTQAASTTLPSVLRWCPPRYVFAGKAKLGPLGTICGEVSIGSGFHAVSCVQLRLTERDSRSSRATASKSIRCEISSANAARNARAAARLSLGVVALRRRFPAASSVFCTRMTPKSSTHVLPAPVGVSTTSRTTGQDGEGACRRIRSTRAIESRYKSATSRRSSRSTRDKSSFTVTSRSLCGESIALPWQARLGRR